MQFRAKQIAPPKDWATFEDLCHALFKKVWNDPLAQKNGRRGQAQHGVDVFGSVNGDRKSYRGVQCKGKDANYGSEAKLPEILAEVGKAENFTPTLEHWIFATTAPVDGALQKAARELSAERKPIGLFSIDVLGWEEIQALIAEHPELIQEFYPEHANHIPQVIEALKALPSLETKLTRLVGDLDTRLVATRPETAAWEAITFKTDRGLGPALFGRPLGPSDASACPRLVEADALAAQLRIAFSARLGGEPGAGKSICSYQVARDFSAAGYEVLRLSDPETTIVDPPAAGRSRRLLFIDNAHLMAPAKLRRLEELASADLLVLSTHNAIEKSDLERGSVTVNAGRAVRTIAAALRADLPRTLNAVRMADDQVGERMMDEDLNQRIDHAEASADRPWQFCFILGGGWRRSKQAAEAAHGVGADFVLAAIAMRQLASRDAIAAPEDIAEVCETVGIRREAVECHLKWLEAERLILSSADCRTPHQRFASVVLNQILVGQDKNGRQRIGQLIDTVLVDPDFPLLGLRSLLHAVWFGIGDYRWWRLPQPTAIETLAARCWQAEGEERGHAALALAELWRFLDDGAVAVIDPHIESFSRWISNPDDGAYAFAHLLNGLHNEAKRTAAAIAAGVEPAPIAAAYSNVAVDTAYGLADLMRTLCAVSEESWKEKMRAAVDKSKLLAFAGDQRLQDKPYVFGPFCTSVLWWDKDLAMDMAERFVPTAQAALAHDPVEAFHELGHDFIMHVLRVFDPLGVYVGMLKPTARQWSIARRMCRPLDPALVAQQLSDARMRQFQSAAGLLDFLFRCAPQKYDAVVRQLDWSKLDAQIGDEWASPSHETEVLLGLLSMREAARSMVSEFIASRADQIVEMPPRFVLLAPEVGIAHVAAGKRLTLAKHGHVEWEMGAVALYLIGEARPDLIAPAVKPFVGEIANSLSSYDRNHAGDAHFLFRLLIDKAPEVWRKVLSALDVDAVERSLAACFRMDASHRHAAAVVVDSAIGKSDAIAAMAQRLRTRFPKASVPTDTPPKHVSRRKRRARGRKK
ncbi:MAG: hypothetical protein PGN16_12610 [Sphingomonas phyllosphaerae]